MSDRSFKESGMHILELMKNDLKSAFKNPIVVITLIAIIILPSLYALLNIQACWDPYERTDQLDFAIANLDNGSSYNGEPIEVGNDLVDELKNNTDFNWKFMSEEELRQGVDNGTYYAGIIIPENFSENVVSITTDNPTSAELIYIVNVKTNPTAAKLSDTGANAVYNKMNAKIVEFINVAAYGKLGELQSSLASGSGQLSSGAGQLSSGASQVSSGASQVSSGASQVSSGASEISSGASQVNTASQQVSSGSAQVQQASQQLQSSVDVDKLPDGQVKEVVKGSVQLANSSSQLAGGASSVAQGSSKLASSSAELASGSSQLAEGALSLAAGSQLLANSAASALFTAASSLSGAANSLSDVTGVDEDQIGDYFYSPVKLNTTRLNDAPNYGSQVAPFYIVLSMWVGAIITCVMIKPGLSSGTKYTPLEMYFGKLLLFIIMAILQGIVTLIGCFWLGIEIDNPLLFIFSCLIVSIVFMILMYSLVSALGQVGKAIGIIILVLQISGTGGIYPIEIMDSLFQFCYPYLPMTHAITLVREAGLGLVMSNYIPALSFMIGLGIATVILAIIVKEKADKAAHYFEEKLKESGLF